MRGSKLYLNLKQWQSTTTSIWRLKKSAKIEMKELMKGQLRNLHLRKLSPIERFKMAFVKVIEFIGVFLPDCSKNDVWMILACWFQPRIRNPHVTIYWLETPKVSMRICLLHWGGHTFHCRLQNHCDMFQGVGHIEGTMLMSAAPLVGIRLWTIFFATCFLSKNLYKCLLRCQKWKIHLCKNGLFQLYTLLYFACIHRIFCQSCTESSKIITHSQLLSHKLF